MEIRQEIYGYAFDTNCPVTVKTCCQPDKTKRERDACLKHGTGTKLSAGRFNILQISKAMREEAMWVVFSKGSLYLDTTSTMAPFLKGWRSKSIRGIASFIQRDAHKSAIWNTAAQFRLVKIDVPEHMVQSGDPTVFTDRLLGIATLLYKAQHECDTAAKSVHVKLGSLFHQMLPFNMESQASDRYGELLDWLCAHSPCAEPDFDKLTCESAHNLHRLVSIAGKQSGYSQWSIFAKTQLDEEDQGGARALRAFQIACAKNGVVFEHLD
jgi:hypothetical protein